MNRFPRTRSRRWLIQSMKSMHLICRLSLAPRPDRGLPSVRRFHNADGFIIDLQGHRAVQRVIPRCLPFLPFAASQSSVSLAELARKLEVRRAPVTLGARATKGPVGPRLPVRHVCFPDPSITRRWAEARPDHSITGRGHQFDFIRSLPLRNPACPPAALRRPFPSTTGCFRRKPLPPSRGRAHKSWSRSTAS
jgi:hypothetical protein